MIQNTPGRRAQNVDSRIVPFYIEISQCIHRYVWHDIYKYQGSSIHRLARKMENVILNIVLVGVVSLTYLPLQPSYVKMSGKPNPGISRSHVGINSFRGPAPSYHYAPGCQFTDLLVGKGAEPLPISWVTFCLKTFKPGPLILSDCLPKCFTFYPGEGGEGGGRMAVHCQG